MSIASRLAKLEERLRPARRDHVMKVEGDHDAGAAGDVRERGDGSLVFTVPRGFFGDPPARLTAAQMARVRPGDAIMGVLIADEDEEEEARRQGGNIRFIQATWTGTRWT